MSHRPVLVVGVDDTPEADAALRFAARLARERGARLRAVSAFTVPFLPEQPLIAIEAAEAEYEADAAQKLAAAVATLDDPAVVDVEQIVVHGAPEDVLLEDAADADLLIVGAHHRRIGRGVSSAVLTEAPCPVIVVPAVQRG